jgi:hypothetical protein
VRNHGKKIYIKNHKIYYVKKEAIRRKGTKACRAGPGGSETLEW